VSTPDPAVYLRATLSPATRKGRERQGVAHIGGTLFFDGVAYVPTGATLVQRLQAGSWVGVDLADADAEGLAEYLAAVDAYHHPPPRPPQPCHPAQHIGTSFYVPPYCHGGHPYDTGCRDLYPHPHNFPPRAEPDDRVRL